MDSTDPTLRGAGACIVGLSHEAEGKTCQDAWRLIRGFRDQGFAVASVSDGAGSASMGGRGARIAAGVAAFWMRANFETALASGTAVVAQGLVAAVRSGLTRAVQRTGANLRDFACTLLVVAVDGKGRWLAAHLGDGGIVGCVDGTVVLISGPSKGEFANETFFVTDHDALEQLQVFGWCAADRRIATALALFTDGLEGALVQARTGMVAPAFQRMFSWFSRHDEKAISTTLARDIGNDMRRRSGDDCTLVLVVSETFMSADGTENAKSALAAEPEVLPEAISSGPATSRPLADALSNGAPPSQVKSIDFQKCEPAVFSVPSTEGAYRRSMDAMHDNHPSLALGNFLLPLVALVLGIGVGGNFAGLKYLDFKRRRRSTVPETGLPSEASKYPQPQKRRRGKTVSSSKASGGRVIVWFTVPLLSLLAVRLVARIAMRLFGRAKVTRRQEREDDLTTRA